MPNKIGATIRAPRNYNSINTSRLSRLTYEIGTKAKINFIEYVFERTMKHVESFAIKLPAVFPCLIIGIILNQHPNIVHKEEVKSKKATPLNFDKKLFVGAHVSDTMVIHNKSQVVGVSSSPISKSTITHVLFVLKEMSKALQDTISLSSLWKQKVDELISLMKRENNVAT